MTNTIKNINKVNQLISENIDDLIFICNENIECEYNNIKELESEKNLVDFLHPEDSKRVIGFVENVFKFGYGKEEFKIIGDKNLFKWYEINGKRFVDDDNTKKVFLICRDITRLKNVEKEIEKSQSRYTQLADTLPEIKYWKLLQSKNSITAIQKTREMLEVVINNIPQLIYWKDTKLVYLGCNTSFATINGLINPHSIIGRTDDDLKWVTDKLAYIQECEHNVMRKDETEYNVIELVITPEGKQIWYEINRIPLHDMGGNVVGILVTYEDISIRKFSEQKLKESEEKYRGILENIKESYFEVDLDGTFTFFNEAFSNLIGFPREEILGVNYQNFLDEANQKKNREVYREVLETEQSKSDFQFQFQNKTGEYLTCESSVYLRYDPDGRKIGFMGLARDITEKYSLERKLKESEEKYRNLVINLTDIILEIDLKGVMTYVSPQSYDILGYSPIELTGKHAFQFIHPEDVPKIAELLKEGIQTKEMISINMYRLLHKNGDVRVVSARGKYVNTNGNERIIAAIRDITIQTQIEEKLKESEENYRTIFNSSPDYIYITDVMGKMLEANQSLLNRVGMPLEELRETNFVQYYAGDDLEGLMEIFQDLTLGKEISGLEIRAKNVHGEIFEYEVNAVPLKTDGEVTRILNLARDITSKKATEQKLQSSQEELKTLNKELEQKVKERTKDLIESERQYRTTIDSLGDPLHVVDRDLRMILVNNAFKSWLTELNIDAEIIGRKILEVFPFLLSKIYDEYEEVFDTGSHLITTETNTVQERVIITETRKIPIFNEGRVEQVITIIRNITESREMENQLKESEEKYRNMVNNLDVGFYRGEYQGKLLMHNQALNRIIGLNPEESVVGIESSQVFTNPETRKQYYKELEEKGYVRNFLAQIEKRNGEIITVDINAHVVYNSEGLPIEAEGTVADITEKFKLQQELLESEKKLRKQNIELMKLDEVKNDFITMAAHELKTPLISISGYTDYILLKHRNFLTPEITEDLKTVQRNVSRLEVLMDKLLEVMKIDENKLKLKKERVNVSKIISDCLNELSYLINEKNLEIILNINHEIMLNVDPTRIFTVFTNLISNAIKFTPDYGWIKITGKKIEDKYFFEVKDNGIGLAEDEIPRLFIKFERIKQPIPSRSINIKDSGTGLGLYITKELVNAHNGEIQASSEGLDKGTSFTFTLPI